MKNRYIYNIFLGLALCLTGCYSDKGNYEYVDINKVDVYLSCGSACTITKGETLKIKAQISFPSGSGDSDRLEYQWYLGGYPDGKLEGEEWRSPEIVWTPDRLMTKETLLIEVHDPVTDIRYFAGTQVTVKAIYDAWGVLVLSEKENGNSMLSYIKWNQENLTDLETAEPSASTQNARSGKLMKSYTEYLDAFSKENGGKDLPAGPISLREHFCADKSSVANILVLTENGAIDVSGKDFTEDPVGSIENVFDGGQYPAGMDYISEAMMMTRVDLVTDPQGHVYTRIRNTNQLFHSGKFLTQRLSYEGEEVSGAHLYMHPHSTNPNACAVYDENAKRLFFVLDTGAAVEAGLMEGDAAAGHSFPIKDSTTPSSEDGSVSMYVSPSDMSAVDKVFYVGYSVDALETTRYNSTIIIFKRDGRYFLEELWISRTFYGRGQIEFNVTQSRIEEIKGLPGDPSDLYLSPYIYLINTKFSETLNPYMMIAVGNQIYVYNISNRTNPVYSYFSEPLRSKVVTVDGEDWFGRWWLAVGLEDGSVIVINTRTPGLSANRVVLYDSKKEMYNATTKAGVQQETDRDVVTFGKIKKVWLKRGGSGWSNGIFSVGQY